MIISRELLLAQREKLNLEIEELIARVNARKGGVNTIDHLLGVLDLSGEGEPKPAEIAQPGT